MKFIIIKRDGHKQIKQDHWETESVTQTGAMKRGKQKRTRNEGEKEVVRHEKEFPSEQLHQQLAMKNFLSLL